MNIKKWQLTQCPSEKDPCRWRLKVLIGEEDLAALIEQLPEIGRPFLLEDDAFSFGFYLGNAQEAQLDRVRQFLDPATAAPAPSGEVDALLSKVTAGIDSLPSTAAPTPPKPADEPKLTVPPASVAPAAAASSIDDLPLNVRYTFEEFIIGPNNRFTAAAAQAVADNPGKIYNPFFIYGGVGLGKTHLMHAVGHYVQRKNPGLKILYVTTEKFMSEVIEAIRQGTVLKLREHYRQVDLLLVDDIQFLVESESTQEEFFHTFNILHQNGKQIIITSDRPPRQLTTLEDRLRSRFEWGLIADIKSPNLETRIAILKKKGENEHLKLDENILLYIASKLKSNIRELEGFLKRINAYASLTHQDVNMDLVKELMSELLPAEELEEAAASSAGPASAPQPPAAPAAPAVPANPYMPYPPYPPQQAYPGVPPGYMPYPPQGYVVMPPPAPAPAPAEPPKAAKPVPPPSAAPAKVPAQPASTESSAASDAADTGLKAVEVAFFFPEGKAEELMKVKERFRDVIRKHRLKFKLEPVFEKAYNWHERVNYAFFSSECKEKHAAIAIVLGPPPESATGAEDFASLLSSVMDDEKISLQLVSWSELNKDYRYLNLALDITLLKHRL